MKLSDVLKKLGKNIKRCRVNAGLRQIDVNEKIGLTYRHYQNIEAGRVNVTVGTLCRLSKLFNTRMTDFLDDCAS